MLVRFTVENFLSIKEPVVLEFMKILSNKHGGRHLDWHLTTDTNGPKTITTPIACLLGTNGSGKTNLIEALRTSLTVITNRFGFNYCNDYQPFLLEDSKTKPTTFEFFMKIDGIGYWYKLSYDKEKIHYESLYVNVDGKRDVKVFERVLDKVTYGKKVKNPVLVKASEDLNTRKTFLKAVIDEEGGGRTNSRILGCVDLNNEHIDRVYCWFLHSFEWSDQPAMDTFNCRRLEQDKELGSFISYALRDVYAGFDFLDADDYEKDGKKILSFYHKNSAGELVPLSLNYETMGTKALIRLLILFYDCLKIKGDRVVVIDDIDQWIDPVWLKWFVHRFIMISKAHNGRVQFLLSTKNPEMLDRDLLRLDEVYILDNYGGKNNKESSGTRMRSLAEYNIPKKMDLRRGYLEGRFNGPFPSPYLNVWYAGDYSVEDCREVVDNFTAIVREMARDEE